MRIMITGSRNRNIPMADMFDAIAGVLRLQTKPLTELIFGDAKTGADRSAYGLAESDRLPYRRFAADWDQHGKAAGVIRNQVMIDEKPDAVIAFWDGRSKGTLDAMTRAAKAGIDVYMHALGEARE